MKVYLYGLAAVALTLGASLAACDKAEKKSNVDAQFGAAYANEGEDDDVPSCKAADVSLVKLGDAADDAQHATTTTYGLVNNGAKTCSMNGYPGVDFRNARGKIQPISVKHPDADPKLVRVKPKAHAVFTVLSGDKAPPCVKGAHLRATVPSDGSKTLDSAETVNMCGQVVVSPVMRAQS